MERKELHHDRHTVSLLTDHIVFSPKQQREMLFGDVALALEGVIRKTCKDLDIEIIDRLSNVDHVHLFIKYPPKYSVSFCSQGNKKEEQQGTARGRFHISRNGAAKVSGRHPVFMAAVGSLVGCCGEIHTESREAERETEIVLALYLSAGFCDYQMGDLCSNERHSFKITIQL